MTNLKPSHSKFVSILAFGIICFEFSGSLTGQEIKTGKGSLGTSPSTIPTPEGPVPLFHVHEHDGFMVDGSPFVFLKEIDDKGKNLQCVKESADASPSPMQILEWLPEDTETFIVAKGPFRLQAEDDNAPENIPLTDLLESLAYSPWTIGKGVLIKELTGQQPVMAAEGARRFRPPAGFGSSIYEGCHVLVFPRDLGPAGDALKSALKKAGAQTLKIEGGDVFLLEEKFEKDLWKFYFAQPKPNVLICATDPGYLTEMLTRMDRPGTKRALPKELPEWRQVDTTSRFWGIRHNAMDFVRGQSGLVFSYDPAQGKENKSAAKVNLLWPGTKIEDAKKAWTYHGEATWEPEVQQVAPNVIEIKASLKQDGDAGRFLYLLLLHLGHGVAV